MQAVIQAIADTCGYRKRSKSHPVKHEKRMKHEKRKISSSDSAGIESKKDNSRELGNQRAPS